MNPSQEVSESKTFDLLRAQKYVLELMARNRPLQDILNEIVRLIETFSGCVSTLYFVEDGKLRLGAAPSFPEDFVKAVDGCPIGPAHGTCGTAAFHGKRIISTDIAVDECWGPYRDWILSYGIKAAWSTPVLSEDGTVMATVSMCWREPRVPTPWDFDIVDVATRLMSIAVERKKYEALILEQQIKLTNSAKLAALGEMSANLAHEINGPLAIIQLYAGQLQILADQGIPPEGIKKSALVIENTVARVSKMIRGLKAISKDADQEPLQKIKVKALIEDTLAFCAERFRKHGVNLSTEITVPDLSIECRPEQISQVLLNLLNNAFDAVLTMTERWVRIEAVRKDNFCVLSVIDSGNGISEPIRVKLMTPFFTTKASTNGTGLGLSISKKIIEAHSGVLTLNAESVNTRFDVTLPVVN